MRKLLALVLVALLAMTLGVALIGCGGGQQTETATPETTSTEMPPADTSMPADTGMGMAADTTMAH